MQKMKITCKNRSDSHSLFPKPLFIAILILFCFNTFRKSLYNAII